MRLAKAALDVGLFTTQLDPMLAFWQQEIGLPFHETLPVGDGVRQLRHGIGESVLKINHSRDPLPSAPPAGYRHLTIAQPRVAAARELTDPDGNRVTLVPPGHDDIEQLQMHLRVRDPSAHHDFFGRVLGLEPDRRRPLSMWRFAAVARTRRSSRAALRRCAASVTAT